MRNLDTLSNQIPKWIGLVKSSTPLAGQTLACRVGNLRSRSARTAEQPSVQTVRWTAAGIRFVRSATTTMSRTLASASLFRTSRLFLTNCIIGARPSNVMAGGAGSMAD